MNETYTTKAIILNRLAAGEDDTRVVVYTQDRGKLELVARGTKKIKSKLAGHLEPICLSNLMIVRGRQFDYIGAAVYNNCYFNIKSDLEKLILAGKAISVFNKIVKLGEKDEATFILLRQFLDVLNNQQKASVSYELLFNFFVLRLAVQLGHKPELYSCVVCRKKIAPNGNKLDLFRGGLVCLNCQKNKPDKQVLPISADCIKILRFTIRSDLKGLIRLKVENKLAIEIINIISSFSKFYSL